MRNPLPGLTVSVLFAFASLCPVSAAEPGKEAPPAGTAELNLPDPLTCADGTRVTAPEVWRNKRRPELLELFRTHVYGRAPLGRPEHLNFEVIETTPDAMEGKATRKLVKISFNGPGGQGAINLNVFIPKSPRPAPCFVLICNRTPGDIDPTRNTKSDFWPAEEIVARGYAAAAFMNSDIDPDFHDGFTNGVHGIFASPGQTRGQDAWGTIAAWAWGASRVMDYLQTDRDIDSKRVAVVGHSRGGKTALWSGAEDERFAMVVSNDSGCGGAALARRKRPGAETVAIINKGFPHWFCDNYKKYAERENEMPVDQHMLAALIAPRLLYVASASEDQWADPEGEFLCAKEAGCVYGVFNLPGITAERMPAPESPLHNAQVGYHLRTGKHNLTKYDWSCFMDFADRHMKPR